MKNENKIVCDVLIRKFTGSLEKVIHRINEKWHFHPPFFLVIYVILLTLQNAISVPVEKVDKSFQKMIFFNKFQSSKLT